MSEAVKTIPPAKKAKGLPTVPILVFIGILVALVVGLLIWALINYQLVLSRDLTVSQNPYCIRFICGDPGTKPVPIQLNPSEDPQRATYQTINYCTVNAPPESLTNALQACSDGSSPVPTELETRLVEFAAFYNDVYVPTCGYSWKSADVPINPSAPPAELADETKNPNGALLSGANDSTLIYLVGCADTVGIVDDPNIEALRKLCGTACTA